VVLKSIFFWDMTPCSALSGTRHFGGTYRLHLQGQRTTRRHIPEEDTLQRMRYLEYTEEMGNAFKFLSECLWRRMRESDCKFKIDFVVTEREMWIGFNWLTIGSNEGIYRARL
jgi:hypothetical protein